MNQYQDTNSPHGERHSSSAGPGASPKEQENGAEDKSGPGKARPGWPPKWRPPKFDTVVGIFVIATGIGTIWQGMLTRESVDVAQRSFEEGARAILVPSAVKVSWDESDPQVTIKIDNLSPSPGRIVRHWSFTYIDCIPLNRELFEKTAPPLSWQHLSTIVGRDSEIHTKMIPLRPEKLEQLYQGGWATVIGTIAYVDRTSKAERLSDYCFFSRPFSKLSSENTWDPCDYHNEQDPKEAAKPATPEREKDSGK